MTISATAAAMAKELTECRLSVALAPANIRNHRRACVRVVLAQNPGWYRRLCDRFASSRVRRNQAFDTKIRRRETLLALGRIAKGARTGVYMERLLAAIADVQSEDSEREKWEKQNDERGEAHHSIGGRLSTCAKR